MRIPIGALVFAPSTVRSSIPTNSTRPPAGLSTGASDAGKSNSSPGEIVTVVAVFATIRDSCFRRYSKLPCGITGSFGSFFSDICTIWPIPPSGYVLSAFVSPKFNTVAPRWGLPVMSNFCRF